MNQQFKTIKNMLLNNTKVVENYFFMTSLQLLSSLLGIIIYPYLIRLLGAEAYGSYVFALAIVSYFTGVVAFGFQLTGLKHITQQNTSVSAKSEIVSGILSAKFYLTIVCLFIFIPLLLFLKEFVDKRVLLALLFVQIIAELLNPTWYFQAIQKMKVVTYFQLSFRLASLPFIFLLVKSSNDLELFALISTLTVVLPSFLLILYMLIVDHIRIRIVSLVQTKKYFIEALPIFISSFLGTIKQESVTVIIGLFFSMKDVALYDLANKIIVLPRMLLNNINVAIFPKITEILTQEKIRQTLRYEWIIGVATMICIAVFGYPAVWLLGGEQMLAAYPLAVILSFTVVVWLVVGAYIYFVFVPRGLNYYITLNQAIALLSFVVFMFIGFIVYNNILSVVLALALSGLSEVIFCRIIIKKRNYL